MEDDYYQGAPDNSMRTDPTPTAPNTICQERRNLPLPSFYSLRNSLGTYPELSQTHTIEGRRTPPNNLRFSPYWKPPSMIPNTHQPQEVSQVFTALADPGLFQINTHQQQFPPRNVEMEIWQLQQKNRKLSTEISYTMELWGKECEMVIEQKRITRELAIINTELTRQLEACKLMITPQTTTNSGHENQQDT